LSHKDAIEALNITAPTFYKRLANCDTIYGRTIYPISNPEVINVNRNKDPKQHSNSQPNPADGEGPQGTQTGAGEEILAESPEEYLSEKAKTVLNKWSNR
jgi:hypothetical protein